MKIKVIMPDKAMDRATLHQREIMLSAALSEGVGISVDCIKRGPDELDCFTDEAFAAAEMIKEAIKAERQGFDAIVIYCFSDVGIDAIRENVRIPVIGPCETTLSVADMLCSRFMVITTESRDIPRSQRSLSKYRVARDKMTSIRSLDIPIREIRTDPQKTCRRIQNICEKAADEQIDGILFGCLSMAGFGSEIEKALSLKVLDPAFIAVAYAEMCARLQLSHTTTSYPPFTNTSHVDL